MRHKPWATLTAAATLAIMAGAASAHDVVYVGTLTTAGEAALSPPSQGTGTVTVVFNDDNFTMNVSVTFSGLTGNTTASHIHCCTANAGVGTAGVATPVPTFPGFPLGVTSGTYTQFFDLTQASSWNTAYITANGGTISSAFAALSTGISGGNAYLNIHTSAAGGGEIRAFLAPVPEPHAWALWMAGIAAICTQRRRGRNAS